MGHNLTKNPIHSSECNQTAMYASYRFIPGRYNPLEEEQNTHNLDQIHLPDYKIL